MLNGNNTIKRKWYAIYTRAAQEQKAKVNLVRQGYEIYLPMMHVDRRKQKKSRTIEPMFPRYHFIKLSDSLNGDSWTPIKATPGVATLIRFGGLPAVIPDWLIEGLMEREDKDGIYAVPALDYRKNDSVRVLNGPFKDFEAKVYKVTSSERVFVLVDILGRQTPVELDYTQVEPLEDVSRETM